MSPNFDDILRARKEQSAMDAAKTAAATPPSEPAAPSVTKTPVSKPQQKKPEENSAKTKKAKKPASEKEYISCRRIPKDLIERVAQHFPPTTSMQEIVNACLWAYLPAEEQEGMPESTRILLDSSRTIEQSALQNDLNSIRDDISAVSRKLSELSMQSHADSVMTAYLLLDQAGYRKQPWPARISDIDFDDGVEDVLDAAERVSPKIKARRRAKKGVVAR